MTNTGKVENTEYVVVSRQWNDWRKARYRLKDIQGVHWDVSSGGVYAPAPQPFVHGYVECNAMVSGELAHSGTHGPCPHSIKVCITRKDNDPRVFKKLMEQAGPKRVKLYEVGPRGGRKVRWVSADSVRSHVEQGLVRP